MVSARASSTIRRIIAVCESLQAADSRELRRAVLAELEAIVPFDFYAWLLTDPETSVGTSPLADVPSVAELPALIRGRYQSAANRWTEFDDPPVARLSTTEASGEWADKLRTYGVVDVATTVFRDRYGCWGFLDLWRSTGPFTSVEEQLLAAVAPDITTALRRGQAATFGAHGSAITVTSGPVVLLLGPDLDVMAQTPESEMQLRRLVPPEGDAPAVPASAYNVGAQLLAVERGIDTNPPSARVHLGDGMWVTARAARLGAAPTGELAVTIEPSSAAERLVLFGLACGLSEREREILALVAGGGSTRQIARAAFVSEHTVQDHLKAIFAKTATHSRGELVSRVLGN